MIDLDDVLSRWLPPRPVADWTADRAVAAAEAAAAANRLSVRYEPGDEEWVLLSDLSGHAGMISVLLPFALTAERLAAPLRRAAPALTVVAINGFWTADLRVSANVLRASLLRHGWAEDFDTEAFCANDLYVESV
ncbi:MAG TPA: hypothetical protein VHX59_11190 [Mycobacteriales bacterium]|nr:hypothetical protein [Mycobacteriales bacterium]